MKTRTKKYDEIKFLLIFLVVIGHILETFIIAGKETTNIYRLRFFIYSFHMPLFIFISGLFSKKNITEKKYTNIIYFLVLYIVIKIISTINIAIQTGDISFNLLSEGDYPWYCFALFAFQMITILLRNKNKTFILVSSIILALIVGYDSNVGDFLVLSRIIVFYPFFFVGYWLDKDKLLEKLSSKKFQITSIIIMIIYVLIIFTKINDLYPFSPLLSGKNSYFTLGENFKIGWAARAVQYFVVFVICFCLISICTIVKKENFTSRIGQNTLPIYALHYIPINFLFFKTLDPMIWMNKILPQCPTLLIFPIAFLIVYVLSFDFWNIPFKFIKEKVTENTNNK